MPPAADAPPRPSTPRFAATLRRPGAHKARPGWTRRLLRPVLALITVVLIADALVGENGWFERGREAERLQTTTAERDHARKNNAALAIRAERLKAKDPAIIEDLARGRLGMLKPGEVLFVEGTKAPSVPETSPVAGR